MNGKIPIILSALAVIAMCAFVFFMSARPADESGAMSMGIVRQIIGFVAPGFGDLPFSEQFRLLHHVEHIVRKIAHFTEFALLGMLVLNLLIHIAQPPGIQSLTPGRIAIAWMLATAYAVTDEVHQVFVPGRSCMFTDVLIDSAGILVGVLLFAGVAALKKR